MSWTQQLHTQYSETTAQLDCLRNDPVSLQSALFIVYLSGPALSAAASVAAAAAPTEAPLLGAWLAACHEGLPAGPAQMCTLA